MVICLERGADLHMAQLMSLPLTVSCFSKIQIGFTFLVLAHSSSPGQRAIKRVYVCMYVYQLLLTHTCATTSWPLLGVYTVDLYNGHKTVVVVVVGTTAGLKIVIIN